MSEGGQSAATQPAGCTAEPVPKIIPLRVEIVVRFAAPQIQMSQQLVDRFCALMKGLSSPGSPEPCRYGLIAVCECLQLDPLGEADAATGRKPSQDRLKALTCLCGQHDASLNGPPHRHTTMNSPRSAESLRGCGFFQQDQAQF